MNALNRRDFCILSSSGLLAAMAPTGLMAAGTPPAGRKGRTDLEYVMIAEGTEKHPRNDSASIIELDDGRLFMVWLEFLQTERAGHDEGLNRISSMISDDRGRTWKRKRVELETAPGDMSVYNPSLLKLANGEILFSYIRYHRLEWGAPYDMSGYLKRSRDGAETFGDPVTIWSHQPIGPANDRMIQLKSGRVVQAVERVPGLRGQKSAIESGCFFSDDNGHTWTLSDTFVRLPLRGSMEGIIAETKDQRLLMAVRNQLGSVFLSESRDGGKNWSKAQTSGLRGGESMPVLRRIPSTGDLVLIWNNSEYDPYSGTHFGLRSPLTVALSIDGGRTWKQRAHIETDPTYEFSNPSCLFTRDGGMIITYFVSKMLDPEPPRKFGRSSMSLKACITSVDWLYSD